MERRPRERMRERSRRSSREERELWSGPLYPVVQVRYRNKCDEKKELIRWSSTVYMLKERIEDFGPKPEPICGSNVMVGVAIRFGHVVVLSLESI